MKKIKFSHQYDKMLNNEYTEIPTKAILMEVLLTKSEELHPRFVEYDTSFYSDDLKNCGYYKIPKGLCLVLILKTEGVDKDMIWTTIRRHTPQKYEYYKKSRGEEFEIEITEATKS